MQLFFYVSGKIIALLIGFYYAKKLSKPFIYILIQIFLALIIETYGWYLSIVLSQYNVWLFNSYYLIELWLLLLCAYLLISNSLFKRIILSLLLLGTAIWASNIYIVGFNTLIIWSILFNSIAFVFSYSYILYNLIFYDDAKLIVQPKFWLCMSMIIYFACNIPLFGLLNFLVDNDMHLAKNLFWINLILNFIRYPMVAVSFYLLGKQGLAAKQKLST